MENPEQRLAMQHDSWRKKNKIRVYLLNYLFINLMEAVMGC